MNCQIYILPTQKSYVWVLQIHFWPPKYLERERIEEKIQKPPKNLTSDILTDTLPPNISSKNRPIIDFLGSIDSYRSSDFFMASEVPSRMRIKRVRGGRT